MRTALLLPLVALAMTACTHQPDAKTGAPAATRPSTAPPKVTPVRSRTGKVASVKPELRFVVVDFALSGVPADGTAMAVYRGGQKVGEIRITGPSVGTNTAADITVGEAKPGDDVRDL